VKQSSSAGTAAPLLFPDPCRLARQVKKFCWLRVPAGELLHLPHKAAGVEESAAAPHLAAELLHLPDKPAGVEQQLR